MCRSTVLNFYAPLRHKLIECFEARSRARADIKFNVREIVQFNVKIKRKRAGLAGWLGASHSDPLQDGNTPTHVRFIANEVQAGLFVGAQPRTVIELPLKKNTSGILQLPGDFMPSVIRVCHALCCSSGGDQLLLTRVLQPRSSRATSEQLRPSIPAARTRHFSPVTKQS